MDTVETINLNEVSKIIINHKEYTYKEIMQIIAKAEKFDAIEQSFKNAQEADVYDEDLLYI